MPSKEITQEDFAFAADVRSRDERLMDYCRERGFTNSKTGWTSYRPEQVEHLNPPTNEERSRAEVIEFATTPPADTYVAYLSADRQRITTWTGETLATVGDITRRRVRGSCVIDEAGTFIADAIDGRRYRGTHNGPGMYCRMRPFKP
jgi:hypothetical protein